MTTYWPHPVTGGHCRSLPQSRLSLCCCSCVQMGNHPVDTADKMDGFARSLGTVWTLFCSIDAIDTPIPSP